MKWLKNLLCDSEDVYATKYFNKHGPSIVDCIAQRNKYGPSGLDACTNKHTKTLLKSPASGEIFDIVDRNAKFYGDYRGCTSDVENETGKPENAILKDCKAVKHYWKNKGTKTQDKYKDENNTLKKKLKTIEESKGKIPKKQLKKVSYDSPDLTVTKKECEEYAKSIGKEFKTNVTGRLSGCAVSYSPAHKRDNISMVYYSTEKNDNKCGTKFKNYISDCIRKNNFKRISSGKVNLKVSKQECEEYAKSIGKELRTDVTGRLTGCSIGYSPANKRDNISMVYYGEYINDNKCGAKFNKYISDCIQKSGKVASKTITETFINIPKKNNGLMYVIFFILALVLFRKLKK